MKIHTHQEKFTCDACLSEGEEKERARWVQVCKNWRISDETLYKDTGNREYSVRAEGFKALIEAMTGKVENGDDALS